MNVKERERGVVEKQGVDVLEFKFTMNEMSRNKDKRFP